MIPLGITSGKGPTEALHEDTDLGFRLRGNVLKTVYVLEAVVAHHSIITRGKGRQDRSRLSLFTRNRQKFLQRWRQHSCWPRTPCAENKMPLRGKRAGSPTGAPSGAFFNALPHRKLCFSDTRTFSPKLIIHIGMGKTGTPSIQRLGMAFEWGRCEV